MRWLFVLFFACLWATVAFSQPAQQFQQGLPASGNAGYPPGSTPTLAPATGNTSGGSLSAILAPPAGQFVYICGWSVDSTGATAAADVTITVGTLIGGNTMSYLLSLPAVAATVDASKTQTYSPCLRGNTTGGTISVTVPTSAGNTSTTINAWGYIE